MSDPVERGGSSSFSLPGSSSGHSGDGSSNSISSSLGEVGEGHLAINRVEDAQSFEFRRRYDFLTEVGVPFHHNPYMTEDTSYSFEDGNIVCWPWFNFLEPRRGKFFFKAYDRLLQLVTNLPHHG